MSPSESQSQDQSQDQSPEQSLVQEIMDDLEQKLRAAIGEQEEEAPMPLGLFFSHPSAHGLLEFWCNCDDSRFLEHTRQVIVERKAKVKGYQS